MSEFKFHIAGVQYAEASECADELEEGMELALIPEPENPYDVNAIKIVYEGEDCEYRLGYVPAKKSAEVGAFLITADEPQCLLTKISRAAKTWERYFVEISDGGA